MDSIHVGVTFAQFHAAALSQAGAPDSAQFSAFTLTLGVLGGLALFLFGLDQMSESLKVVAGGRMKSVLASLTRNRFLGVLTGAFVTAVIQSSSVTTVLIVGFISAGLISMTQSIGVIMGANIGTTITAQIIAFKITEYALLLIVVGFFVLFLGKRERIRHYGTGILGLGLIFYGMGVMGDAMAPLREDSLFLNSMARMENPGLGILAGAIFTALVQSSSATTGVVIVLAGQGFITLPAGIALAFGANIGTCVTALLAAIRKPREAVRAALVHVLFNVLGVLIWLSFIDQLAQLVTWLSPGAPELTGVARMASETPRQIANAHTIFNVANTMIFIGFAGLFARLVGAVVPDRPPKEGEEVSPRYLDVELLATPSLALDRARLEILHMGDWVVRMLKAILPAMLKGERETLIEVREMDSAVDLLHGDIIDYLGKVSRIALTRAQTEEFIRLMEAVNSLESIGDLIETNLVNAGLARIDQQITISDRTQKVIQDFHTEVMRALTASLQAVTQKNPEAARIVIDMKTTINRLADSASQHQALRLVAEEPKRLPTYALETDILAHLRRCYYFCKRMAKVAALPESAASPEAGQVTG